LLLICWSTFSDRVGLVDGVSSLVQAFRAARQPVIWVRQEFEPDLSDAFLEMRHKNIHITIRGTRGCETIPELGLLPDEVQIIKKRYSAFFGTRLDEVLSAHTADTIVLAGINTHACVRTTAIDAYQRDLDVIITREAVSSYDRDHAAMSLRYMDGKIVSVLPLDTVISLLRRGTWRC
jgi:nicotinamidase-related amidase